MASTMSSVEREAHGNARERKDDNESGAEDRDVGGVLTVARLGPRAELRRLDGDLSPRKIADLDLRTCERAAREPAHAATESGRSGRTCDSTWVFTCAGSQWARERRRRGEACLRHVRGVRRAIGRMVSLRTQNRHAIVSILRKRWACEPVRGASAHYRLELILTCAGKRRDVSGQALMGY